MYFKNYRNTPYAPHYLKFGNIIFILHHAYFSWFCNVLCGYFKILKGFNFHNRWSSTIGRKTAISYCLKGKTNGAYKSPAFQA
ncbi:MAG: hypothetical protein LBJ63_10185 [Prevotellaceae bacterium]|jgi:hypothetical protein|nr:hypothetical protein [Prevotellaceae bacterium]